VPAWSRERVSRAAGRNLRAGPCEKSEPADQHHARGGSLQEAGGVRRRRARSVPHAPRHITDGSRM